MQMMKSAQEIVATGLVESPGGLKLDLGCAESKRDGWVGIDVRELPGVDIVWDLEDIPWPLPDECAQVAIMGCLLPHINPAKFGTIKFMNELWRVMKFDCQIAISMPYGDSEVAKADPTHCQYFVEQSFLYFDPLHESKLYKVYKPKPWKIEHCTFNSGGTMELVLVKRREDPSYYV
jgi:hypothetical protein